MSAPTVTINRTQYATNPDYSSVSGTTVVRTNYATNPHAASATGWAYAAGTGEVGSTTTEVTAGPDGQNGFMRRTITTVKTSGSTGWQYGGTSSSAVSGVAGDVGYGRMSLRASSAVNGVLRLQFYLGSTLVNAVDAAQITLTAGNWVEATVSGAATGTYDNMRLWFYHTTPNVPQVGTLDATQACLEKGYGGYYFDGGTTNTPDLTYAWTGTAGASTTTATGNTMWSTGVSAGTGGAARLYQSSDVPPGTPATKSAFALLTVGNTGGSSGITTTPTTSGNAGDVMSASCWVKFNVDRSIRLLTRFRNGSTVVNSDALATTWFVPANTWTFIKTEGIVATGAYTNVQIWPWLVTPSSIILNDGDTMQVALMQIEKASTVGTWFCGATSPVTPPGYSPAATLLYSWAGTANGSFSYESLSVPLQDFQVQLNGGPIVGAGKSVGLQSIAGLRALPDRIDGDTARGQMDGELTGPSYLAGRPVQFTFQAFDPSSGLESALHDLSSNWQNIRNASDKAMTVGEYLSLVATADPKPVSFLEVQLPGRPVPLLLLGRPSRFSMPVDIAYAHRNPTIQAEWKIPDGVLYDSGVVSGTCGLPNPVAGFTFPASAPFTFGSSTGGSVSLLNGGDYPAWSVVKITGPCIRPKVTLQTGEFIAINLTLKTGDVLLIDMQNKVVTYNGANRNNAVDYGSSFFMCPAGLNTIGFQSSDSLAVAGQMSAYLLSTYSVI